MDMIEPFRPTCPSCGEVDVNLQNISIGVPQRIGFIANYMFSCPECHHGVGGTLTQSELVELAVKGAKLLPFVPPEPEIEPNYQPPLTESSITEFAKRIRNASPTLILASLMDPRDFL